MGRPIQKRKIGQGTAKIEVTSAYFTGGGSAITSALEAPIYIDRQRSSVQFLVVNSQTGASEKLKLVGKASPGEGEFCIAVTIDNDPDGNLDDSTLYYVTKLHNRTVSCQPNNTPGSMIHLAYQLRTDGDNEVLGDGFTLANIDVQK